MFASCRVSMAIPWNCMSNLKPWAISQTSLWKGSLQMRSSVVLWNQCISLRPMVPGLNLHGCWAAPVLGVHLPPCEDDFCPCVAQLKLSVLFHDVFLFQACCFRAPLYSLLGLPSLLGSGQEGTKGALLFELCLGLSDSLLSLGLGQIFLHILSGAWSQQGLPSMAEVPQSLLIVGFGFLLSHLNLMLQVLHLHFCSS